jgi:hypothetical protein
MVHMANNAVNKWNFSWAPTPVGASDISFEGIIQPTCVSAVTSKVWRRAPVSKMLADPAFWRLCPHPPPYLRNHL